MNDENLIPVKPGEVHNPRGRGPGTKNHKTILKKFLNQDLPLDRMEEFQDQIAAPNCTIEDALWLKAIRMALDGDIKALTLVFAYAYGLPKAMHLIKDITPLIKEGDADSLRKHIENQGYVGAPEDDEDG